MFNRITLKLMAFSDDKKRFQLLRMLVEGDLTYDVLLKAPSIKDIFRANGVSNDLLEAINDLNRVIQRTEDAEGKKLLDKFRSLSIAERVTSVDEYQLSLSKVVRANSSVWDGFNKTKWQDTSVVYAIYHLIDMFLYQAYQIDDVSLVEMLNVLRALAKNPLEKLKIDHPDFSHAVDQFQSLYRMLEHAYLTNDKVTYINQLACLVFNRELNLRAPQCKILRCLDKMKAELSKNEAKDHVFMIFGEKVPETVLEIKKKLADMPADFNLLNGEAEDKIRELLRIFTQIKSIVESEQKGSIFRSKNLDKFWQGWSVKLNEVENQYAEVTNLKYVSRAAKK